MEQKGCIFCNIIKTKNTPFILKEDSFVVIKDINPKAPIHLLVIPKTHIVNLMSVSKDYWKVVFECVASSKILAKKFQVDSFSFISNNGAGAGQSVFHLHWHFLSGINIYQNGLKL